MNEKYTIISRDEFIKLYKFGKLSLIQSQIIDENIEKIKNIEKLLKELPFDDEFGFLIIKFSFYQKDFKNFYSLDIKNLNTLYCLSVSAKEWFSIKFNSKIRFQVMEDLDIEEIKEFKELENIKKGSKVIFKMFNDNLENREIVKNKLKVFSLTEYLLNFNKEKNYFKSEYKNFYFDLIAYQRENKFNKNDVSFLYDLIIIILLKSRRDIDFILYKSGNFNLKKYKSYKLLNDNKQKNLYEHIEFIKNSQDEKIKAFISNFDNFESLVAGAIFLKIRALLDEEDGRKNDYQKEIKKLVDDFKDEYKQELSIAFYLIGSLFGYSKLYDDFYDTENLNIFKDEVKNTEIDEIEILRIENKKLKKLQKEKDSKIEEIEKLKVSLKSERDAQIKKLEAEQEAKTELEKVQKEKASLKSERDAQIKKLEAEQEAKTELEKVQKKKDSKIEELEKVKASLESEKDAQIKKLEAEQEAKAELERVQKEKNSTIKELKKEKASLKSEKDAQIKKLEAEQEAKAELERVQKEKNSKIKELEEAKATLKSERDAQTKKLKEEQEAKAELERVQKEKNSKIEELEKEKASLKSEKDAQIKKLEAEQEAKAELERVQKEKNSKIKELEEAKATLKSEKDAQIKKLEAEQEAKAELERVQKEKDSTIKELEKPKVTIQEFIKIESKVETKKETVDDILKDIIDVEKLQHIVKKLNIKSKAKTVSGLKKAIKKAYSSDDKIDRLKIVLQEKGLFAECN